jgi:hypothetical protein
MAPSLDFETYPRSRGVFHEVLLAHLNEHGASTIAELEARPLSWFYLPLNHDEIADVMESARRHGLVVPLDHRVDGHERPLRGVEWAPTERGAALHEPSGMSRRSLFSGLVSGPTRFRQTLADVLPLIGFFAGAAVLKQLTDGSTRFVIAGAIVAVLLLVMLERGIRAEQRLCEAAQAWPRLASWRPRYHKWQMGRLRRFWVLSAGFVVLVASYGLALADVIGDFAATLGVLAAVLSYAWIRVRQDEVEKELNVAPLTDYANELRAAGTPD